MTSLKGGDTMFDLMSLFVGGSVLGASFWECFWFGKCK